MQFRESHVCSRLRNVLRRMKNCRRGHNSLITFNMRNVNTKGNTGRNVKKNKAGQNRARYNLVMNLRMKVPQGLILGRYCGTSLAMNSW